MSNKTDLQTLNAEYALLIDEVRNNVIGHSHDDRYYTEDEIDVKLSNSGIPIIVASSTDGVTYTANLENALGLVAGMKITIIPNMTSTDRNVVLNLNGFGDKYVRMPVSYNTSATSNGPTEAWIVENKPVTLEYDGEEYWKTINFSRPSAQYLYGAVPIENGGTGATTIEEARANLGISSGGAFEYGTEDLEAGVSELEEGKVYFVYE